jgi:hypothetical protein
LAAVAVTAAAAASMPSDWGAGTNYPLRSRCIGIATDEACAVLPVAAADRWMPSAHVQLHISLGCGYSLPDAAGSYLQVMNFDVERKPQNAMMGAPKVPESAQWSTDRGWFTLPTQDLLIGGSEPGTVLFNVTLVDGGNQTVVDWMLACLNFVLPPQVFGVPPRSPQAAADPAAPLWGVPYLPMLANDASMMEIASSEYEQTFASLMAPYVCHPRTLVVIMSE